MREQQRRPVRVCVVGSGTRFLSGISYYTQQLSTAMAARYPLSVVLLRRLMPARWYPGRVRVGAHLAVLRYPSSASVYDGVDWYWGTTILRAARLLRHERPDVVVLQWWTGTVLHTFLALAWISKRLGARVVLEFHEVQDVGELGVPLAKRYVDSVFPLLLRLVDGAMVHSEYDRTAVEKRYGLGDRPLMVVPHGPYPAPPTRRPPEESTRSSEICTLLYFGVIRPFKGVEDLVRAFDRLPETEAVRYRLKVVGEIWEGHTLPSELIAGSRYRDRIEQVSRYITDDEVTALFAAADVVVLPYHRSSASGPLHLAMSAGLPVVVTRVGGLIEAARDYRGAIFVPPHDVDALGAALPKAATLRGQRFPDPHSWERTVDRYAEMFSAIGAGGHPV
ncbi:MAG: glycosyltransferase family 4 protein [Pseudonocardiaceae bacterium]